MAPIRLKLTMELAPAFGLFGPDGVAVEGPAPATRAELELYRSPAYIDVVRLAGGGRLLGPGKQDMTERVLLMHGLGTEDDPCSPACTRRPLDPGAATPGCGVSTCPR